MIGAIVKAAALSTRRTAYAEETTLRALAEIAFALTPAVVFSQGGKTKPTHGHLHHARKKSTSSTRTGKESIGTSRWSTSATRTSRSASFIAARP